MNAHPTGAAAASNLQSGARLALVGLAVNVAFAFIKIAAGVFGNAYALIADGIESALDAAGSIVIWGGPRFPLRSLAAKNGNGRMIMLPCLPVPSSLPPGRVYSARRCGKFSIPRRAVKLSRVFDALHVQCLA